MQDAPVVVGEVGEDRFDAAYPGRSTALEQGAAGGRRGGADHPPVLGGPFAYGEPGGLQRPDRLGDRRRTDLLHLREAGQRHRPDEDEHRQRGGARSVEVHLDVCGTGEAKYSDGCRMQQVCGIVTTRFLNHGEVF